MSDNSLAEVAKNFAQFAALALVSMHDPEETAKKLVVQLRNSDS